MKKIYFILITLFSISPAINSQITNIPDSRFEETLINKGIDDVLDGSVLTANISNIISLDLNVIGPITDLTGIEDFTSLQILKCDNHDFTSLDLSANLMLTELDCSSNKLTSLDFSANTALTKLNCKSNQITSLDLSANIALKDLQCYDNQISSINVNGLVNLEALIARWNQLTSLDISTNTSLNFLNVQNNQLTCIQVNETQLEGLNSGSFLYIGYYTDNGTDYALNCAALSVNNFDEIQYSFYPNPTSSILNIKGMTSDFSISIYDVLGKVVISQKATTQVDISTLKKGVYFVRISDGNKTSTKKVFKI